MRPVAGPTPVDPEPDTTPAGNCSLAPRGGSTSRIYLIDVPTAITSALRNHRALAGESLIISEAGDVLGDLEQEPDAVAVIVIGSAHGHAVQLAQQIVPLDRDVEVTILDDGPGADEIGRALRFAPFVGPEVRAVDAGDADTLASLLSAAAERTRARRRDRRAVQRGAPQSAGVGVVVPPEVSLADLLSHVPLGVVFADRTGIIRGWNARAARILDMAEDEALGSPLADLIASERIRDVIARAATGAEASARAERRRRDGQQQWIQITAASLPTSGEGTIMLVLQDVTIPAVAEHVLDRSLRETELLNAIASTAAGQADLDRILSATLNQLENVLPFTGGSIALVDGDDLVIRAAAGPFAHQAKGQRLRRGPARSWQVVETREPFLSTDVQAEGARPTTDIRSYLAVPLVWAGRAFGVLEIDSTAAGAFQGSDVDLLRRVAAVLSGPLQLALRYDLEVRALAAAEQARQRLELVAEVSRILAASLDHETALTNVARLLVPAVADWVLFDVIQADGTVQSVALAHAQPAHEELARALRQRYPPHPDRPHPIFTVVRTGASVVENEITSEDLRRRAADEEHYAMLQTMGIHAHMIVPLLARGHVLGVLSVVGCTPGRRFAREDLDLAEEIGRRAARAIDTAHLYAAEQRARAEAEEAFRRVNAMNALISLAGSALDLGAVFDEFGEIMRTLVPFVHAAVSLHVPETDAVTLPHFTGASSGGIRGRLEGPKTGSARGWVLEQSRPYIRVDTHAANEFSEDHALGSAGLQAYLIVPMRVGRRTIGTLHFGHDQPGAYTEAHARIAQPIADQLALTVSRSELFEQVQRRAGELSEALQRALLPAGLPEPPFTSIGALYLPADPQAGIGGDWYDAMHLPDDSILLSLGDVAGHGVPAAAAMGQVRHIVRAYALEGRDPAEILRTVNRFLCRLPEGPPLSLWLGLVDPYTGVFTYGGAGHPPVLLLGPGDSMVSLPCTGPPLGLILDSAHPQHQLILSPGTRLIASTDGLIEAGRDLEENERRFHAAAMAGRAARPAEAAETIVRQVLRGHTHEDDIAILVFDTLPPDAPLAFTVPAVPESLHRVRRAVRTYAAWAGVPAGRVEEVVFAVGEASLNSVEHAYRGSSGQLRVRADRREGRLVVIVRDEGEWRDPTERGRGRGMRLMRQFADDVQVEAGPDGTVVTLSWALPANAGE